MEPHEHEAQRGYEVKKIQIVGGKEACYAWQRRQVNPIWYATGPQCSWSLINIG